VVVAYAVVLFTVIVLPLGSEIPCPSSVKRR
jgi:hypothetical protein